MKSPTISNETVRKSTGKSWGEWFVLLKKIKAQQLSHTEIAQRLCDEYGVPGWWAQTITVEFERKIGRRELGQTCDGDYQASVSKTLPGTMDDALKKWQKYVKSKKDLCGVKFSTKPNASKTDKWRYWRVDLADGTKITVIFGNKGSGKAHLAVNHEKLPNAKAVAHWKSYWKEFLKGLTIKTST